MTTPFREHQFRQRTSEFLEHFGKAYIKSVGWEVIEDVQNIVASNSKNQKRQLQYRDWKSVPRTDLFEGFCSITTGVGPGSFTKWRCVYIVENQDYNIEIYKDKKDYEENKMADMIEMSGYHLTVNPTDHYRVESVWLAGALELTPRDVEALSCFSDVSWALTHPWRKNYIFQLDTGPQPSCWCWAKNTVEPSETEDTESKRETYMSLMENCLTKTCAEGDSIQSKAFRRTVETLSAQYNRPGYIDNGTCEQILTNMVMEFCFKPMRHDVLRELTGPDSMRLSVWYKIQDTAYTLAEKIVSEVWSKTEETSLVAEVKVREMVSEKMEEVKQIQNQLTQALIEKVSEHLDKIMEMTVHPVIKPIIRVMEEPIQRMFDAPKQKFVQKVPDVDKLPSDTEERNKYLDLIPRDPDVLSELTSRAYGVMDSINQISKICEIVLHNGTTVKYKDELLNSVLQVLDGAVYSLQIRLQDDNISDKDGCKAEVIQCMEHDFSLAKRDFVTRVIVSLLHRKVDILLKNKLQMDFMQNMEEGIPSDLKECIVVQNIYDSILTNLVKEPTITVIGYLYQTKDTSQ